MAGILRRLTRELWTDRRGQDLIEYTLLLGFVALGVVGIALGMGADTSSIWGTTSTTLAVANQTSTGSTAAPAAPTQPSGSPYHHDEH